MPVDDVVAFTVALLEKYADATDISVNMYKPNL